MNIIENSSDVEETILFKDKGGLPLIISRQNNISSDVWLENHHKEIEKNLLKYGGVLLRGLNINSLEDFNQFALTFSKGKLLTYENASTPRKKLAGQIYTSTEYPKDREILMHNENSYTKKWPSFLLFYSIIPATTGGQTPFVSSRRMLSSLNTKIIEQFEEYGVLYTRNYVKGLDVPWEQVFSTNIRSEVEQYCKNNNIKYNWDIDDLIELHTAQLCQATTTHPITGDKVWFNQANLFHSSHLSQETRELYNQIGLKNPTRDAFYGDGTAIKKETISYINSVYSEHMMLFPWEKNDLLIIDNLLLAHGRKPYDGERKIVVAMS